MAILKHAVDRRAARRLPLDEIQSVVAVKLQSEEVEVVNASRSGLLIECGLRLPPGSASQFEIVRPDAVLRVRGRVVRCEVTRVSAGRLAYQIAIALNTELDFIDDVQAEDLGEQERTAPVAVPAVATIVGEISVESAFAAW